MGSRCLYEVGETLGWVILFLCFAFIMAVMFPRAAFRVIDAIGYTVVTILGVY